MQIISIWDNLPEMSSFGGKIKKNISNLSSAKLAQWVVVKVSMGTHTVSRGTFTTFMVHNE